VVSLAYRKGDVASYGSEGINMSALLAGLAVPKWLRAGEK
jgi:hypothetical protein